MSEEPIVHTVYSVAETATANVLVLDIDMTDAYGQRTRAPFISTPDDTYGLGPIVLQWLADNPDFPRQPFVPPTPEEARQNMPTLSRLEFRTGFKAAGITTAVITETIAAVEDPDKREDYEIIWEESTSFRRMDDFVLLVTTGKTPEQVDEIWMASTNI